MSSWCALVWQSLVDGCSYFGALVGTRQCRSEPCRSSKRGLFARFACSEPRFASLRCRRVSTVLTANCCTDKCTQSACICQAVVAPTFARIRKRVTENEPGKVDFLRGGLPIAVTLVLLEKSGDHRPQGIGMHGQQSPLVVEKKLTKSAFSVGLFC
jgi:hypothetical protein